MKKYKIMSITVLQRWVLSGHHGKLIVYQQKQVVFGLTSSPFLLAAVIQYQLERTREEANMHASPYSHATVNCLKRCFYVDNVVASFDTQSED